MFNILDSFLEEVLRFNLIDRLEDSQHYPYFRLWENQNRPDSRLIAYLHLLSPCRLCEVSRHKKCVGHDPGSSHGSESSPTHPRTDHSESYRPTFPQNTLSFTHQRIFKQNSRLVIQEQQDELLVSRVFWFEANQAFHLFDIIAVAKHQHVVLVEPANATILNQLALEQIVKLVGHSTEREESDHEGQEKLFHNVLLFAV